MSDPEESIFRGANAQECEDFIRSVRKAALSSGKEGDNTWIAHYAASCFAGAALRWLEGLDEEFQYDWKKLRKAMLQRWLDEKTEDSVERSSAIALVPTSPAAAPPPARLAQGSFSTIKTQFSLVKRGYIRVDGTSSTRTVYLDSLLSPDGSFWTTVEAKDRMLVEIVATKPPYRIKLLNTAGRTWLALKWKKVQSIEKGTTRSAGTVALNEFGEYHSQRTPRIWVGPHRASVWSVGMDGTIQAWWEESVTCLMEALYRGSDHFVVFAPDASAYIAKDPRWTQVRLVFEPLP